MAAAVREELLHTGKDSDLIIRSEGRDFNVHKVIVSAASPVLDRACNNGLLESHTGIIEHNEFDVDTVERMVEYVYKTNYQLPTAPTIRVPSHMPGKTGARDELTVIGTNAKLIMHTRVYATADYYIYRALRTWPYSDCSKTSSLLLSTALSTS